MKKIRCDNCDFLTNCEKVETRDSEYWLCSICFHTHLSNALVYSSNMTSADAAIMKGIAYIGNLIISKLEK